MDWNSPRVCRRAGMPSLLALILLASPVDVVAQPKPADEVRVATLIKQLGDRDFSTRRGAFQRLAKIGNGSREQLEKALNDADPEIRLRRSTARSDQTRRDLGPESDHPGGRWTARGGYPARARQAEWEQDPRGRPVRNVCRERT